MSQQEAYSWREMLAHVTDQLGDSNEARWICEHASGCDREEFIAELNNGVTVTMASTVHKMVARRMGGEPLQYVMRRWAFRHLDVMVDERVLIPRPETEQVVEFALGLAREMQMRLSRRLQIVDMGTGSGVIGLAIASELSLGAADVLLTDASSEALDVARANLVGIGRAATQVRIAHGSWYDALPLSLHNNVDLLVSNPPYIAEHDDEVTADVRMYEPHVALYSGRDGLAALRTIIGGAGEWLTSGGWLVCEIGYRQSEAVRELFNVAGLVEVRICNDLAGRPRIAAGRAN